MGGMTRGAAPDLIYPAALTEGMVKRAVEGFAHEAKRVQEVALARAVWADEEDERAQLHRARRDALVVFEHDARYQNGLIHGFCYSIHTRWLPYESGVFI